MFDNGDLIFRYSRADALRDGSLIDLSPMAREVGILHPVAITRAAWNRCIAIPPGAHAQDERGREWDVLWMMRCAIRRSGDCSVIEFGVHVRADNSDEIPPLVKLKAVCAPGDDGEPTITVMLPDED